MPKKVSQSKATDKQLPLWRHKASGVWCCKRKGRHFYFTKDLDESLQLYEVGREYYARGMHPPDEKATLVRDLLNAFEQHQRQRDADGEITRATYLQWRRSCDYIADGLDKLLPIDALRPSHFEEMRRKLAKRLGPTTLGNELNRCRQVFNWGYQNEVCDTLPRFGTALRRPSKKKVRQARGKRSQRLYSAEDIRALVAAAKPDLRAMILLGINCGLGPADIGRLERSHIRGQWLDESRGKTGVERRAWLWPETRAALEAYQRPAAAERDLGRLVFLTRRGRPYCKVGERSATGEEIARRFRRLAEKTLDDRRDRAFYDLRRTFRTRASDAKDEQAADLVMGHESGKMSALYTLETRDDRLQAVSEHVRRWLFCESRRADE